MQAGQEVEEYLDEAECEVCEVWFGYIIINPNLPRVVCNSCIAEWRQRYTQRDHGIVV